MACNYIPITCHYMHYMSLHATEDANVKWFSDQPRTSQERCDKGYTSPMHGIQCDEVEFQNCTSLVKYKYMPVHTGIYRYILVHTSKTQQTSFDHAPSSLRCLQVSDSQTTQARLSTAKVPQPTVDLIHVAATPAIRSCRVCRLCTAQGKS